MIASDSAGGRVRVAWSADRYVAAMRAQLADVAASTRTRLDRARREGKPDVQPVDAWLAAQRPDLLPAKWDDEDWRLDVLHALLADVFAPGRESEYDERAALRQRVYALDTWEEAQRPFEPYDIGPAVQATADAVRAAGERVASAVDRAGAWRGSPVYVEASGGPDFAAPTGFTVYIGAAGRFGGRGYVVTPAGNDAPAFTLFVGGEGEGEDIDDVLEGGDEEFFPATPEGARLQADYFDLIAELRRPGSTATRGRTLTLYTARPVADRALYERGERLPVNLFLTSSFDDAEGIARDMGGRDVWEARLHERDLVKTLDAPRVQHYQIVAEEGAVPVRAPELVLPGVGKQGEGRP